MLNSEPLTNRNFFPFSNDEKEQPNYSMHSVINNNLNGNNYNNEFIEKMFNENYNFKHEISSLKNKLVQFKIENEKLKSKLKKYIQQSEFLEKKLENYKISNGSNLYLFSNNVNGSNSSLRQPSDFERLYHEKCEELENFELNFNKISEKFSDVLGKIQHYQFNLIEDNKRLKEFLIFILQCFNHKQYEHITCIVNYAREHQTFIDKQIFETPGADSFKAIEKNYFGKSSNIENIMNPLKNNFNNINVSNNNNNINLDVNPKKNDNVKLSEYLSSDENDKENKSFKKVDQNSKGNSNIDLNYENLKFSKTVTDKIGLNSKGQSVNNNNNSNTNQTNDLINMNISSNSNAKNKTPNPSNSSSKIIIQSEKTKDFSYSNLVNLNLFFNIIYFISKFS